jgi:hypothetical protein
MSLVKHFSVLLLLLQLVACDMLGLDSPEKQRALSDADGRAVGAACRHAGRAIEDCYVLNPATNRAAVFNGWKEMNDYMTKNKIEVVKPQVLPTGSTTTATKLPGSIFEPPTKTGTAAQFVPPDSIKKDSPEDKKTKVAPLPAPVPSPAAPQKSAAKDGRIVAQVDNATVMRAKEQAHTPSPRTN